MTPRESYLEAQLTAAQAYIAILEARLLEKSPQDPDRTIVEIKNDRFGSQDFYDKVKSELHSRGQDLSIAAKWYGLDSESFSRILNGSSPAYPATNAGYVLAAISRYLGVPVSPAKTKEPA